MPCKSLKTLGGTPKSLHYTCQHRISAAAFMPLDSVMMANFTPMAARSLWTAPKRPSREVSMSCPASASRSLPVAASPRPPFAAEDPAGSLVAEAPAQYKPRHPERTAFYRLFEDHFDGYVRGYEDRFEPRSGRTRNFCSRCQAKRSDDLLNVRDGDGIDACERLVEYEELRRQNESPRDLGAPPFSTRQGEGRGVGEMQDAQAAHRASIIRVRRSPEGSPADSRTTRRFCSTVIFRNIEDS